MENKAFVKARYERRVPHRYFMCKFLTKISYNLLILCTKLFGVIYVRGAASNIKGRVE